MGVCDTVSNSMDVCLCKSAECQVAAPTVAMCPSDASSAENDIHRVQETKGLMDMGTACSAEKSGYLSTEILLYQSVWIIVITEVRSKQRSRTKPGQNNRRAQGLSCQSAKSPAA